MRSPIHSILILAAAAALPLLTAAADGNGSTTIIAPSLRIVTTFVPLPPATPTAPSSQTGCPTVTATRELCTTCPVPACLGLSTVTQSCGCPTPVPTVYLDFPCADNCKGVWCTTSFDIITPSETCSLAGSSNSGKGSNTTVTGGTSSSTSSLVQTNVAGRMAIPGLGLMWWWFLACSLILLPC
ncbi:hypothetical protein B0H63DRAFT_474249 [Podospora didyma]|uniref:Extracellular membrane protein CFEM domain-containing protein n=1 Tax=Podospora didyma TaxID=330526 RepID=A0AAE0U0H7_9PEZI|nr:hypothetical protein B0H63DRAFT_474249 [Podospora didyma]